MHHGSCDKTKRIFGKKIALHRMCPDPAPAPAEILNISEKTKCQRI
jgi:hypothetical protein